MNAIGRAVTLMPFALAGCTEPALVMDMEAAYQARNQQETNVSTAVKKHFPSGMKLSEALARLQAFGFEVTEFGQEGVRKLPDGQLWKYNDESHRRAALRDARLSYSGQYYYDHHLLLRLLRKRAVIAFYSDGEQISDPRGHVYIDGL